MNDIVKSIRKARIEHKRWVGYVIATIDEIKLNKKNQPANILNSEFGKWYHQDQWGLSALKSYKKIKQHHIAIHELYDEMNLIVSKQRKPSLLQKFSGEELKLSKRDRKILINKFQDFDMCSKTMLRLLRSLQNEVIEHAENEIENNMKLA